MERCRDGGVGIGELDWCEKKGERNGEGEGEVKRWDGMVGLDRVCIV